MRKRIPKLLYPPRWWPPCTPRRIFERRMMLSIRLTFLPFPLLDNLLNIKQDPFCCSPLYSRKRYLLGRGLIRESFAIHLRHRLQTQPSQLGQPRPLYIYIYVSRSFADWQLLCTAPVAYRSSLSVITKFLIGGETVVMKIERQGAKRSIQTSSSSSHCLPYQQEEEE